MPPGCCQVQAIYRTGIVQGLGGTGGKIDVIIHQPATKGVFQLLVTPAIGKPGGITISEALAKRLPMLIVKPIPGHEQMNTDYLVKNKVAIKVSALADLETFITQLFSNPLALKNMRERAGKFSKPNSAIDIAQTILKRIM